MPKVLHLHGLRVVIYPDDHAPAHVHVLGAGCEVVLELSADLPVRRSKGFAL